MERKTFLPNCCCGEKGTGSFYLLAVSFVKGVEAVRIID
jgi:hypothetical protein